MSLRWRRRCVRDLVPLSLALLIGGCVLSLDPLYSDADLAFDPALLGIWKPADANEAWECRKDDHGGYRVLYTDEQGRRGEFSAHLLAVQGERFLDLFPAPPPTTLNSFYTDHWVAGHTFARVLGIGAELKLAILDEQWLAERTPSAGAVPPHRQWATPHHRDGGGTATLSDRQSRSRRRLPSGAGLAKSLVNRAP